MIFKGTHDFTSSKRSSPAVISTSKQSKKIQNYLTYPLEKASSHSHILRHQTTKELLWHMVT